MTTESACLVLHAGQPKLGLQPCKTHGSDVVPVEIILELGRTKLTMSHMYLVQQHSYHDVHQNDHWEQSRVDLPPQFRLCLQSLLLRHGRNKWWRYEFAIIDSVTCDRRMRVIGNAINGRLVVDGRRGSHGGDVRVGR